MLLGDVLVGLALFGASVIAALAAVVIAGVGGMHHLRTVLTRAGMRPDSQPDPHVVQLDRSEYDYR